MMNFNYNGNNQYFHQHGYNNNNGYHHHPHHQERNNHHHRNDHFYNHKPTHHHYNNGNDYQSYSDPQYQNNRYHDHTRHRQHHQHASFHSNNNYHNPHNHGHTNHHHQHHSHRHNHHPRTHSNSYNHQHNRPRNVRRPQHEILSSKTETFTFGKKVRQTPIFYDPESDIARKCNQIKQRFDDTMFEDEEKQRLLHFERCTLIREHEVRRNHEDCDSEDKPVTPSASECSDQEEQYANAKDAQDERIGYSGYGAVIKDRRVCNIWETTQDHVMIDANGRNILDNEREDKTQFGIYNADGIKEQAMIVPDVATIDGEYITNNAKCVKKKAKKKEMNLNKKKKKRRRGGKGKGNKHKILTQQQIDEMKAKELVAYLEMCRHSSM